MTCEYICCWGCMYEYPGACQLDVAAGCRTTQITAELENTYL